MPAVSETRRALCECEHGLPVTHRLQYQVGALGDFGAGCSPKVCEMLICEVCALDEAYNRDELTHIEMHERKLFALTAWRSGERQPPDELTLIPLQEKVAKKEPQPMTDPAPALAPDDEIVTESEAMRRLDIQRRKLKEWREDGKLTVRGRQPGHGTPSFLYSWQECQRVHQEEQEARTTRGMFGPDAPDDLLPQSEVGRQLDIPAATLWNWRREKRLRAWTRGQSVYLSLSETARVRTAVEAETKAREAAAAAATTIAAPAEAVAPVEAPAQIVPPEPAQSGEIAPLPPVAPLAAPEAALTAAELLAAPAGSAFVIEAVRLRARDSNVALEIDRASAHPLTLLVDGQAFEITTGEAGALAAMIEAAREFLRERAA